MLTQFARMARLGLGAVQSASIAAMVQQAAAQYGVNPQLALAIAQQESALNPNAVNPKSGAAGVMQLMPATAASLGVTNSLDPSQNIPAGVSLFAQYLQQFGGDQVAAVAAYDWGPTNVTNAQARYGANWLAYAPAETQNYVATVLGPSAAASAAAPSAPAAPIITIDADTGQVVETSVSTDAVDSMTPVNGGLIDSGNLLLLAGGALALYFLSDYL